MKKIFNTHFLFVVSLVLKGLYAFFESAAGIAVLFVSKNAFIKIVGLLAREELTEDPKDIIANYFIALAQGYSASFRIFASVYLLIHGIAKLFLIYGLLKKKMFAYPAAIIVFSLFIVYQVYAFSIKASIGLAVLTVLDIFVIILTWLEYKNIRKIDTHQ